MLYFLQTYIKPGTGQRFCSLRTVERYLTGEKACTATPKVPTPSKQISVSFTISDVVPSTYLCMVCHYLVYSSFFQSVVKSGTGNHTARGLRSCRRAVKKRPSVAEEDKVFPEALKHSVQSTVSFKTIDFIIQQPKRKNDCTFSASN